MNFDSRFDKRKTYNKIRFPLIDTRCINEISQIIKSTNLQWNIFFKFVKEN